MAISYLLSSIAANAFFMSIYINLGYNITTIGASGAKSGLLGFCLVMFIYELLTKGFDDSKAVFADNAIVLILIAFEIVLSFLPNVAWAAHIGGALTGTVLAAIWLVLHMRKTTAR